MAKLFDTMTAGPVLCTFMHYSIVIFCSPPEVASNAISSIFVRKIVRPINANNLSYLDRIAPKNISDIKEYIFLMVSAMTL